MELTFEELQAEAERQGFKLIRKRPYIEFVPCECGFNYRNLIHDTNNNQVIWECCLCGKRVSGKNQVDAKINWNRIMSGRELYE